MDNSTGLWKKDEYEKCPYCGNSENFHNNYDFTKKNPYENIINVLCNECGLIFNADGTKIIQTNQ